MAVSIVYASLQDASDNFRKAADQCKKYRRELDDVVDVLRKLPGEDDCGYVNNALSSAKAKAQNAANLESRSRKISEKIANFSEYAKRQDKNAATSVSTSISTAVGKRGIIQRVGDWIYNSYVNFLDKMESLGPIGKLLAQGIRKLQNLVGDATRSIVNFFKYGLGKYILNGLNAVKDLLLAVSLVIGAIAAAVFTGPVWLAVVSFIAIGAATVYLICQMADTMKQIDANAKAYTLEEDGNITAARYYGDIDGVQSYVDHHDFGDKKANDRMSDYAKKFSTTKTVSKVTATLTTMVCSFASLGLTQSPDGKQVVDFKRALQGKKYQMLHDGGFNSNDYQTGGFNGKTAFNPLEKIFKMKNTSNIEKITGGTLKEFGYILDINKWISNGEKIIGGTSSLIRGETSGYGTLETVMDIVGFVPIADSFLGDAWDIIDGGKKLIFDVNSSPARTEPNSYFEYLFEHKLATAAATVASIDIGGFVSGGGFPGGGLLDIVGRISSSGGFHSGGEGRRF